MSPNRMSRTLMAEDVERALGQAPDEHDSARRELDADIPGPRFERLAGLRFLAGWFPFLEECRRRYGDAFRLTLPVWGPVVVLADPEAIRSVYLERNATSTRAIRARAAQTLLEGNSLAFMEGDAHVHRRRLLISRLTGEALSEAEHVVTEVARDHAARLSPGQEVRLLDLTPTVTIDVMGRVLLGLDDPRAILRFRELFLRLMPAWSLTMVLPDRARTERVPGAWRRFARVRAELRAFVFDQIARHRAGGGPESSICAHLLAATDEDGEPITDAEAYGELLLLAIGGSHTTGIAMAWMLDYLLHDVETRERVERNPDDVHLLDTIVWETLRLRTVIDSGPRILKRDMQLSGCTVPAGTVAYPSAYLVNRQPAEHPDPDRFIPARFADRPPTPFGWLPFGGGTHRCIGPALAQLEMRVATAELLRQWRLRPLRSGLSRPTRKTLFWVPAGGVPVKVVAAA